MVYYKEKLRTIYKGGGFMFNFDFYNPTHIVFGKDRLAELDQRKALTIAEYEKIFFEEAQLDAEGNQTFQGYQDQTYALSEINEHQRTYVKVEHHG